MKSEDCRGKGKESAERGAGANQVPPEQSVSSSILAILVLQLPLICCPLSAQTVSASSIRTALYNLPPNAAKVLNVFFSLLFCGLKTASELLIKYWKSAGRGKREREQRLLFLSSAANKFPTRMLTPSHFLFLPLPLANLFDALQFALRNQSAVPSLPPCLHLALVHADSDKCYFVKVFYTVGGNT